jgi:putative ABC transport system permease protein
MTRDFVTAARALRRDPGFVATVVFTFALAIAANAAMFGLVDRLMLSPPPGIANAERVARVQLWVNQDGGESFPMTTTSYPVFRALRESTGAFASVAATRSDTMLIGRSPDVTRVSGIGATGEYFTTLGASAALGRFFGASDDELPAGTPVVVLGDAYWRRIYGADRSVIGRQIVIGEQPFTIIGVARAGFNGDQLAAVDLYVPLSAMMRAQGSSWMTNHGMHIVSLVARLRDGVGLETARKIATVAIRGESVGERATLSVDFDPVVPGAGSRQSAQSRIALWLAAVSLIVLLIAAANVGTLLALRAARRRREIAVRIAIGAGRRDLARHLVSESLLLAACGAAAGVLLSRWFSGIIRSTLLPNLAPTMDFIDGRVLVVSIVAAGAVGLFAALAPILQVGDGGNLAVELRAGGAGASARMRFQNLLVTVQVALCTLLVIGAALFVRSLERVQSQDLGFSAEHLLYVTLDFHGFVPGPERDAAYFTAVDRVRGVAGVTGATVAAGVPFGPHSIPPVSIPNLAWPPVNVQIPIMYAATTDYLDIMRVRLVSGRLFSASDTRGSAQVVLVNETLAKTAWSGSSALGKCVRVGGAMPMSDENPAASQPCREVVGVVRDSRARSLLPARNEDRLMQYYVPFEQLPDSPFPGMPRVMGLVVRAAGDPLSVAGQVQRAIQTSSARRVYALIHPYQDLIDPQLRSWQLGATLFSAFSIIALSIATIGLFGVISYAATQRTQEMGIRRALGSSSVAVAALIVGASLRRTAVGLIVGVVAALLAGGLVAALLFQTSPRDPASIASACAVLALATLVAASWPALRAMRVDPMVALRAE